MKPLAMLLAGLLIAGTAGAGDVYVTKDAQGNPIFTDTPQSIPAQKVDIHSEPTSPAPPQGAKLQEKQQVGAKAPPQQADAQQAAVSPTEDKAKRCADARQEYQTLMNSWRIYSPGPNGERTYLTSDQIDAARANAKQVMDEFCADQ